MTSFKDYPYFSDENLKGVVAQVRQICNTRKDDISQIGNLTNIFMSGRKVGKIPTSSNDVTITDRVGDQNYDQNYLYILIDNAGTAQWRRFTAGSW